MAKKRRVKVVFDTNILISSFVYPGGIILEIMDKALNGVIKAGISREILDEFKQALTFKFGRSCGYVDGLIAVLAGQFTLVSPSKTINFVKNDPADNIIIECADEFGADFIITGDSHLLMLKKYKKIKIVTAAEFIREVWVRP